MTLPARVAIVVLRRHMLAARKKACAPCALLLAAAERLGAHGDGYALTFRPPDLIEARPEKGLPILFRIGTRAQAWLEHYSKAYDARQGIETNIEQVIEERSSNESPRAARDDPTISAQNDPTRTRAPCVVHEIVAYGGL